MEDLDDIYELIGLSEDARDDISLSLALSELGSTSKKYASEAKTALESAISLASNADDFCKRAVNSVFNNNLALALQKVTF